MSLSIEEKESLKKELEEDVKDESFLDIRSSLVFEISSL